MKPLVQGCMVVGGGSWLFEGGLVAGGNVSLVAGVGSLVSRDADWLFAGDEGGLAAGGGSLVSTDAG